MDASEGSAAGRPDFYITSIIQNVVKGDLGVLGGLQCPRGPYGPGGPGAPEGLRLFSIVSLHSTHAVWNRLQNVIGPWARVEKATQGLCIDSIEAVATQGL